MPKLHDNAAALVIGLGGIGNAFAEWVLQQNIFSQLLLLSRTIDRPELAQLKSHNKVVYSDTLIHDADDIEYVQLNHLKSFVESEDINLDFVVICTGILHDKVAQPEKSFKQLHYEAFNHVFTINSWLPLSLAAQCLPIMNYHADQKLRPKVLSALSARVGSITDNGIGGWYSYRMSKAALNMGLKTLSVESLRKYKQTCILSLHPGTVQSDLSKPFAKKLPDDKYFSPSFSAESLGEIMLKAEMEDHGKFFAWDHQEIPW